MAIYVESTTAQFENVNSLRHYPFREDCSLLDINGRVLPNEIISDIGLVVPSDLAGVDNCEVDVHNQITSPVVRLTGVHLSPSMISVCFLSRFNGKDNALSVTVSKENFKPYFPYRLNPLAGTSDMGGIVSFGNVEFSGFVDIYRFTEAAFDNAIVHPSCVCMASPAKLRGFIDRRSGERIYGDVRIAFTGYIESQQSGGKVKLSLSDDAVSELVSDCLDVTEYNPCGATSIQSINGVHPDDDGNIVLWFH